MKFRTILFLIAFSAISQSSFAQFAKDAIRFSTWQTGTTSRIKGIGNANVAVGGDMTSIGGNPAGLGYFTHSEMSVTPEFDGYNNNTSYLGQTSSASRNTANMSNAAIVFYNQVDESGNRDKGWLSLNWGVAYNRTNNFYEQVQYGAKNNANSITDYYANLANNQGLTDNSLQQWASDQKLIDAYGSGSTFTYKSNAFPGVQQAGFISRTGGQSSYDISVGANYSNKLYLGFGLGISELRYNTNTSFNETGDASVLEGSTPVTRGYNSTYTQFQNTKGEGFNFKLGVLYKIIESVRVGATITTPTFYTVNDSFNEGLNTSLNPGAAFDNGPVEYATTYQMRTPFKFAGGLSIFLGNIGFITGDVTYEDFTTTHMSDAPDYGYTSSIDNATINSNYQSVVNLHTGAEIKIVDAIFFRGGYGIEGNPLKGGTNTKMVTGGLGYHLGNYYVDAAYVNIKGSQNVMQYAAGAGTPAAAVNATNNNIFLTIGVKY